MSTTPSNVALGGTTPVELAAALGESPDLVAAVTAGEGDDGARRAHDRARARPAFGLARWVPDGTEIHSLRVASYDDKLACIDAIDRFAAQHELRGKYREAIVSCVDELVMNALYAAPRASAARGDKPSAATIAARARRGVRVSWALVDRVLYVSALDSYGSIERDAMLGAMTGGGGGAADGGLGVTLMAGSCNHMWVAVAPGEVSECVCAFDTRAPRMQLCELGFVQIADPDEIAAVTGELELADELALRASAADSGGSSPTVALLVAGVALVVVAIIVALVWA